MKIKSITLNNFKNFAGKHTFEFDKATLLAGVNGTGKSTILEALTFAIWGYSPKGALSDIPTRTKAKSCSGGAVIEYLGHIYEVIRHYPLKLVVKVDGVLQDLSTAEANKFLIDTFGTREFFTKFILCDAGNPETNFLEQGQVALKRIIFAGTDERFNNAREKISEIKAEREKLNASSTVLYKHYPSEKRMEILTTNLVDFSNSLVVAEEEMDSFVKEIHKKNILMSENRSKVEYIRKQLDNVDQIRSSFDSDLNRCQSRINTLRLAIENCTQKIEKLDKDDKLVIDTNKCNTCKQPLPQLNKEEILIQREAERAECKNKIINFDSEILDNENKIKTLTENIEKERLEKVETFKKEIIVLQEKEIELEEAIINEQEILELDKKNYAEQQKKFDRLNNFKVRLETRLKQKEYIYTDQDVLVAKKAIEELDKLSSYYLVESVKTLEPIINSVLDKINFQVSFDVDIKGKFNILLTKEEIQYKYADLSTGEKLILQIAFKLSILMRDNKADLLICDEGLGSLDIENLEHILEIIKSYPTQLIMVLHRYDPTDTDIKVIRLTKSLPL